MIRLAIWLTVVTALAAAAFFGAPNLDDRLSALLPLVVQIGWLVGAIIILCHAYWGGTRPGYRWSARLHFAVVAELGVISVIAPIAYFGLQSPGESAGWPAWLIVSAILFAIAFYLLAVPYGAHIRTEWIITELVLVSALSTGTLAALWLLEGHIDRLPWVVAGAWLLVVVRLLDVGRDF